MVIPHIDEELLKKVFFSEKGKELLEKIKNEFPLKKMLTAVCSNESENVYYDKTIWKDQRWFKMSHLQRIFFWPEGNRKLSDNEAFQFYNWYIVPIWNFVYGKHLPLIFNEEEEKDNIAIKSPGDLTDLMWLLKNCLEIEELDLGIYPSVRGKKERFVNEEDKIKKKVIIEE